MQRNNAKTITRNSFWYAVDASAATLVMLIASVPVARVMGPEVLGHYIFLVFMTTIAQRLANVGIPATAGKYMAEYLASGQSGIAREIFGATLRYQVMVATVVTTAGFGIVRVLAEPQYALVSYLIVLSMWPSMVNNIPAQANVAAENLRANIPASVVNFVSYSLLIVLTLVLGWGLVGLACATLLSRSLEAAVRYHGVHRWLRDIPRAPLPAELGRRMFRFSQQNLLLLALGLVVWDRSELLFLRYFGDVTQIAFYSLAFSITNQLLMAPRAFSASIGYTVLAQYGRDRTRLDALIRNATRYVALLALPMFLGLAALSHPLIGTVYGSRYMAVVPVLSIMSVLSIPRAFQTHSESLLQATEAQGFMVRWLFCAAVLNLLLDWFLIPPYGAIGAAIANGIAQSVAVGGVWAKGTAALRIKLPTRFLRRVTVSAALMSAIVLPIGMLLPGLPALLVGVPTGVVAFGLMIRLLKCLEPEDLVRFRELSRRLPSRLWPTIDMVLRLLMPHGDEQRLEPAGAS